MGKTAPWTKDRQPNTKPSPYQSGFCGIGSCEGTKPKSPSGRPMRTCEQTSAECHCECHVSLDKLFEMMDMPRLTQPNPEYVPEQVVRIMPSIEERAARFSRGDPTPAVVVESVLPDRVPATIERSYAGTPSGRAGRGQLELWVKRSCDEWVVEKLDESCTPKWISQRIAEKEGISPPSVGAIGAVFDRWTEIGFALVARKPVRFIGYLPDGVKYGLEELKIRHKAKRK